MDARDIKQRVTSCRRHIQLQSSGRLAIGQIATQLWRTEGVPGFYRGFIPSAIKNLPNKGDVRFFRALLRALLLFGWCAQNAVCRLAADHL